MSHRISLLVSTERLRIRSLNFASASTYSKHVDELTVSVVKIPGHRSLSALINNHYQILAIDEGFKEIKYYIYFQTKQH